MTASDTPVLIYSTCPDHECAQSIATALISDRLAACVNIIPGMISVYRWQGKVTSDKEVVLIIKSRQAVAEKVVAKVKSLHPYDVPAALVLDVTAGCPEFMDWVVTESDGAATASGDP